MREPCVLPPGADYEHWCDVQSAMLERLLRQLDEEQRQWDEHERLCGLARKARAGGLQTPDPEPPVLLFRWVRQLASLSSADRERIVAASTDHRKPFPAPVVIIDHHGRGFVLRQTVAAKEDIALWLLGEALARGLVCDFDTSYQLWFVYADMLLRDADIGAIIARVHPERSARPSPKKMAEAGTDERKLNADLARKERKRVNAKRVSFGYRAA